MKYLTFPIRSLIILLYCLVDALASWCEISVATWRMLAYRAGSDVSLEEHLAKCDGAAELAEPYDIVAFWHELQGVVEDVSVWDDNVLRYDVRVCVSPVQRYLRPHEVSKIILKRRK